MNTHYFNNACEIIPAAGKVSFLLSNLVQINLFIKSGQKDNKRSSITEI